jgi:hypothetical protein
VRCLPVPQTRTQLAHAAMLLTPGRVRLAGIEPAESSRHPVVRPRGTDHACHDQRGSAIPSVRSRN